MEDLLLNNHHHKDTLSEIRSKIQNQKLKRNGAPNCQQMVMGKTVTLLLNQQSIRERRHSGQQPKKKEVI